MSFAAPELLALFIVVLLMGYLALRLHRWRQRARSASPGRRPHAGARHFPSLQRSSCWRQRR
jgi:hypothetical protein